MPTVLKYSTLCFVGGLFGSSTFSQPVTSSTSSGFGFGTASGTSNSLFGNTSTGGGGLFSQQSNAFGTNKPASFGSKALLDVSLSVNFVNQLIPVGFTVIRTSRYYLDDFCLKTNYLGLLTKIKTKFAHCKSRHISFTIE